MTAILVWLGAGSALAHPAIGFFPQEVEMMRAQLELRLDPDNDSLRGQLAYMFFLVGQLERLSRSDFGCW